MIYTDKSGQECESELHGEKKWFVLGGLTLLLLLLAACHVQGQDTVNYWSLRDYLRFEDSIQKAKCAAHYDTIFGAMQYIDWQALEPPSVKVKSYILIDEDTVGYYRDDWEDGRYYDKNGFLTQYPSGWVSGYVVRDACRKTVCYLDHKKRKIANLYIFIWVEKPATVTQQKPTP